MINKHAVAATSVACGLLLAGIPVAPTSFGADLSESDIEASRQNWGVPDEEREMSNEEVISLMGQKAWAHYAIRLRCRLADDATRREIYDTLSKLAIDPPRRMVRSDVLTILGQQREYGDDAVPSVLEVLAATEHPLDKEGCYRALGLLGGPEAIRVLKEAILEGPPHERFAREVYFNLYTYLGFCGPDAAPVLFQIEQDLDTVNRTSLYSALGGTGTEEVIPYLLEKAHMASVAGETYVLEVVLRAAALHGRAYSLATREEIAGVLVENADSTAYNLREVVAWGLGEVGDETHIPLLERMASDDPHTVTKASTKGGVTTEKLVYPVRKVAGKSIDIIRHRTAEQQAGSNP